MKLCFFKIRCGFLLWKLKDWRSLEPSPDARATCTWTWTSPTRPCNTWTTSPSSSTRTGDSVESKELLYNGFLALDKCLLENVGEWHWLSKLHLFIYFCSFGVIPTSPLPIHTPLMPNQSIDASLPLNTVGPVMKMDPLNNLQVQKQVSQHLCTVAEERLSPEQHSFQQELLNHLLEAVSERKLSKWLWSIHTELNRSLKFSFSIICLQWA